MSRELTDVEYARRAQERHKQNRSRLASAYARYETTGTGSEQFEDPADFGLTFLERPFVAVGYTLDLDELADALGLSDENPDIPIPLATGYVVEWDRDANDFYVGAWCAARVAFDLDVRTELPEDFLVTIQYHFTFSGIAIKDVPEELDDVDQVAKTVFDQAERSD